MKNFWLVKQEPSDYSWSNFVADSGTSWTGVRNFAARNNLRRMSKGDEVLFYHSGEEKAVALLIAMRRRKKAIGARSILFRSNRCVDRSRCAKLKQNHR